MKKWLKYFLRIKTEIPNPTPVELCQNITRKLSADEMRERVLKEQRMIEFAEMALTRAQQMPQYRYGLGGFQQASQIDWNQHAAFQAQQQSQMMHNQAVMLHQMQMIQNQF